MPKKSLDVLKNDLLKLQKEIAAQENKLKLELGGEVLSKTGVSSLKEFKAQYTILKKDVELVKSVEAENNVEYFNKKK